ncbi:PREDICTED: uncharacterized protein LOC109129454 [Camelina sativa]|uniref:Uncharacterized protein LOC109129454 n=1 Tax=Camelina sativa TaxID=90675 RepID=A0ABM1R2L4_CAMSA|nr:PREDICTED: uncharacterized protein LOC109129454 [Camelina sativa]
MQICYFRKDPHTPKSLKPKSDLFFLLQTGYKLCVELLNLHGRRGLHARENPPVMLRSCTYPFQILVIIASLGTLSLSNVSSPSCFHDEYKQHALITISTRYDLSKLNSQSSTTVAINLNQWSNITFAQTLVKALPRVVLLVPARSTSLAPSPTPFRLVTLANQSSFDSLLEDLLIILDLTYFNV